MQVVDYAILNTLTRLLLERTVPLQRKLVFQLMNLVGLTFLVLSK